MIFDTSFIIDLIRNKEKAISKFKELKKKESWGVASPTVFELWSGLARSNYPEKEKQKVEEVLNTQPVISFDRESAEKAGLIEGNLIKKGKAIENIDCMVAAIAITNNEVLVTRNAKHFSRIKDLKIETY